jgi:hypothetical protein
MTSNGNGYHTGGFTIVAQAPAPVSYEHFVIAYGCINPDAKVLAHSMLQMLRNSPDIPSGLSFAELIDLHETYTNGFLEERNACRQYPVLTINRTVTNSAIDSTHWANTLGSY